MRGVRAGSRAEQLETRIETGNQPGIEHSAAPLLRSCIVSQGTLIAGKGLHAARIGPGDALRGGEFPPQ